jgi:hypothetical protein
VLLLLGNQSRVFRVYGADLTGSPVIHLQPPTEQKKRIQSLKTHQQLGVVVHACNPSYSGGRSRRTMTWRSDQAKSSKSMSQKQEGWRYGLSGRVLLKN